MSTEPAHPRPGDAALLPLRCHPHTPAVAVRDVRAGIRADDVHWLRIRWRIEGAAALIVRPFAGSGRSDGLWRTTCFELFVAPEAGGYCEFNFSPSERWAAYDFTGYRAGMAERAMPRRPVCTFRPGGACGMFDVAVPAAALPPLPWRFGLSAVIGERGGVKSCWALAHPPGKPDFHDPVCFAARLAAPGAP